MNPVVLTLRKPPKTWLDMSTITPDRLDGLANRAIKSLHVPYGKGTVALGEFFSVTGSDTSNIHIHKGSQLLTRVGSGMAYGEINVRGRVGAYLGARMTGGILKLNGNAGDFAGAGMQGGCIRITGDVGEFAGAALPGEGHGMSGGRLVIEGNAGGRLGDRIRRGTILVFGDTGPFPGARMIAGTLVLLGNTAGTVGYGMRRGTIILGHTPSRVTDNFNACGPLKMAFLRILFKQLGASGGKLARFRSMGPEALRYAGDIAVGGKGEILILTAVSVTA